MSDADHRREPRVSRSFMVRYRAPTEGHGGWLVSPLRDLSRVGARFVCEYAFDVGVLLEMELVLPTSKQPVPIKARVVRAKPVQWGMAELGVAFEPVDPAIQQSLEDAVTYYLRKQEKG